MPRDAIAEPEMAAALDAVSSPPGAEEQAATARKMGATAATRRGEVVMVSSAHRNVRAPRPAQPATGGEIVAATSPPRDKARWVKAFSRGVALLGPRAVLDR